MVGCASGRRSKACMPWILEAGYTNVVENNTGWGGWCVPGLPAPAAPQPPLVCLSSLLSPCTHLALLAAMWQRACARIVGGSVCSASPLRGEGSESVAWLDGRGIGEPYAMANATPGRERERERELFLGNGETHLGTHSHMWSGCLAGWRRSCPSSEQQYAQHKVRRGGVLGDHLGWLLSAARWSLRNVGLG